MKSVLGIVLGAVLAGVFIGCDANLVSPTTATALAQAASANGAVAITVEPAQAEGEAIAMTSRVHPERPGETIVVTQDWANIYDALSQGREVDLRLTAGRFYINQSIRVFRFSGSIKGAGRAEFLETGDPQNPIWLNPASSTIIEAGRGPVSGQVLGAIPTTVGT